ncbi:MAG: SpoIIE family protein phosphatase [Treponema sp.]|jgi:sigma-B regulation protein RsbU (phosphoserine phosphatase)|nr:SpoIIE family protein phosphatase [Treponema sp.]
MSDTEEFIDASFFTSDGSSEKASELNSEQQAAESRNNLFSFRQLGSAVKYVEPVSGDAALDTVRQMFADDPELAAVPIEHNDTVVGVLTRKEVEEATGTVLKRFMSSDCIQYTKECPIVLYAREYFANVINKVTKISIERGLIYFPVYQLNKSFYGIISIDVIEDHLATIREQDLEKAKNVQQNMLPTETDLTALPFKVSIWNRMANAVGGDFYTAAKIADHFYVVGCFDVSGKNVAAALITVLLSAFFSMLKILQNAVSPDPSEITAKLDQYLTNVMPIGNFITGALCYIDMKTEKVKVFNCGHTLVYALLPVDKGGVQRVGLAHMEAALPPLGMGEITGELKGNGSNKKSVAIPLKSGLHIDMYSDGFTDMQTEDGTRFGEDRVKQYFMEKYKCAPSEIKKTVERTVDNWVMKTPLSDDITVMDIRFM